jgi:branched-chain amino acid transport system ATP-binding protein
MMSDRALLDVTNLAAGYGRTSVLNDIDLRVDRGEIVSLIGSNGAGKSTLLKAIVGLVTPTSGAVCVDGRAVTGQRPEKLVTQGLALVPEGRLLFGPLSVAQNLALGAYTTSGSAQRAVTAGRLARVHDLFPVLAERAAQSADTLSGGEQQMLAVGRALMSGPRLLLLDEPSLGLAPKVIGEIFSALERLRADGVTMLLVEQDAKLALKHSDRGYVMRTGRIVLTGSAAELVKDESVRTIYLGSWKTEGDAT